MIFLRSTLLPPSSTPSCADSFRSPALHLTGRFLFQERLLSLVPPFWNSAPSAIGPFPTKGRDVGGRFSAPEIRFRRRRLSRRVFFFLAVPPSFFCTLGFVEVNPLVALTAPTFRFLGPPRFIEAEFLFFPLTSDRLTHMLFPPPSVPMDLSPTQSSRFLKTLTASALTACFLSCMPV